MSISERKLFLANIFKEAEGKELKIACSQSSRTLERLIMLSSPSQLKDLFSAFNGQYVSWLSPDLIGADGLVTRT